MPIIKSDQDKEISAAKALINLKSANRDQQPVTMPSQSLYKQAANATTTKLQLVRDSGKKLIKQAIQSIAQDIALADKEIGDAVAKEDLVFDKAYISSMATHSSRNEPCQDGTTQRKFNYTRYTMIQLIVKCELLISGIMHQSYRQGTEPSADPEDLEEICKGILAVRDLYDIHLETPATVTFLRAMQISQNTEKTSLMVKRTQEGNDEANAWVKILTPEKLKQAARQLPYPIQPDTHDQAKPSTESYFHKQ